MNRSECILQLLRVTKRNSDLLFPFYFRATSLDNWLISITCKISYLLCLKHPNFQNSWYNIQQAHFGSGRKTHLSHKRCHPIPKRTVVSWVHWISELKNGEVNVDFEIKKSSLLPPSRNTSKLSQIKENYVPNYIPNHHVTEENIKNNMSFLI